MVRKGQDVLRSGYGISYAGALRGYVGVDGTIGGVPGINFGGQGLMYTPPTYTSLSTLSVPIPLPSGTPTTVPFLVPANRSGQIQTYDRDAQYIQNWNLEIQREIARNTTVEVRYVGTKGSKLWGSMNLNAIDALHRTPDLFDAFNAVRAGNESVLLNQMLMGINLGGAGAQTVNGTTWTGAMAVRTNTTTRAALANGNVGAFTNFLNTNTTGTGSSDAGAILRRNGFAENYIVVNPQYTNVTMHRNLQSSTYHSMQMQFTRRLAQGITNTTTWTVSKSLGDSGTYRDPTRRDIEKEILDADRTHQITSNGTYELPFGPNRTFLRNAPGWVSRLVEKWQLGGIMNYNTGAPLTITSGISTISTTGAQPNLVGALPKDMGKVTKVSNGVVYFDGYTQIQDPYFNKVSTQNGLSSAFSNKAIVSPEGETILVNPQPGEIGTLGYGTLRGPSSIGFDVNLIKRITIHENKEFEIRIDSINVLNTPNFGNPTVDMNSANNFGRITTATGARRFVLNARLNF